MSDLRFLGPALLLVAATAACTVDNTDADHTVQLRNLDVVDFACNVQPVLVRRCSMLACHGVEGHALRLYSPGKLRQGVDPTASINDRNAAQTLDELALNYCSVIGVANAPGLANSQVGSDDTLLLHKPLAPSLGGGEHKGGVIFQTRDDPDYVTIRAWLEGASAKLPTGGCGPLTDPGQVAPCH